MYISKKRWKALIDLIEKEQKKLDNLDDIILGHKYIFFPRDRDVGLEYNVAKLQDEMKLLYKYLNVTKVTTPETTKLEKRKKVVK